MNYRGGRRNIEAKTVPGSSLIPQPEVSSNQQDPIVQNGQMTNYETPARTLQVRATTSH